jgi:hypothetical protein
MTHEALRHLTQERRQTREREADVERLAVHARRRRVVRANERTPTARLALLLAARRHAIQ